jgi:hypothetical protein
VRLLHCVIAATIAAVVLSGCLGGGGSDADKTPDPTATPEAPGPEDVIAAWVRDNRSVDYVGDCGDAQEGIDVGKICSSLVGTRGRTRAYTLGPTFSEYTSTMLIEEVDGTWTVLTVTNRDPNAPVPGIEWPLQQGDRVIFIGLGEECLSIREQPTILANRTICMADGTEAIILEGPVEADGYTWWRVAGDGFNGWAVSIYMRLPEAIEQLFATPTPTPE